MPWLPVGGAWMLYGRTYASQDAGLNKIVGWIENSSNVGIYYHHKSGEITCLENFHEIVIFWSLDSSLPDASSTIKCLSLEMLFDLSEYFELLIETGQLRFYMLIEEENRAWAKMALEEAEG